MSANPQSQITINLNQSNGEINPFIYGQFIEHLERCITGGIYEEQSPLSGMNGFRHDVLDKVLALNPPMLRWPGGTFSKIYHWHDGIGPKESRPHKKNLIWGGIEDNHFGTDEFIQYCREIGSEPFLTVNMASGTAEEAANWVDYCNGTEDTYYANLRRSHGYVEPHAVKYWGLGNEEYGKEDIGLLHDPQKYTDACWEFIKWMKLTDPSIQFIMVGTSQIAGEWNKHVLRELGDVCDYFSLHFYASSNLERYGDVFKQIEDMEQLIIEGEVLLAETPQQVKNFPQWYRFPPRQQPIKLAIDEWNIWDVNRGSAIDPYGFAITYSWRDALWIASVFNLFHRHADAIGMAQLAQMVNVLAPIVTNETGSVKQTIFYPLELYREHCGNRSLKVELSPTANFKDGPEDILLACLDASATLMESTSTITLIVVNRHPADTIKATPSFQSDHLETSAFILTQLLELNAASWQTQQTFGNPDEVITTNKITSTYIPGSAYAFPAHSITLFKFKSI